MMVSRRREGGGIARLQRLPPLVDPILKLTQAATLREMTRTRAGSAIYCLLVKFIVRQTTTV